MFPPDEIQELTFLIYGPDLAVNMISIILVGLSVKRLFVDPHPRAAAMGHRLRDR
jgi:hypothetical protein